MKYSYLDPEFWRGISAVKGVLLAAMLLSGSALYFAGVMANYLVGKTSLFDVVMTPVMLFITYVEVFAMVKGLLLRKATK